MQDKLRWGKETALALSFFEERVAWSLSIASGRGGMGLSDGKGDDEEDYRSNGGTHCRG